MSSHHSQEVIPAQQSENICIASNEIKTDILLASLTVITDLFVMITKYICSNIIQATTARLEHDRSINLVFYFKMYNTRSQHAHWETYTMKCVFISERISKCPYLIYTRQIIYPESAIYDPVADK